MLPLTGVNQDYFTICSKTVQRNEEAPLPRPTIRRGPNATPWSEQRKNVLENPLSAPAVLIDLESNACPRGHRCNTTYTLSGAIQLAHNTLIFKDKFR